MKDKINLSTIFSFISMVCMIVIMITVLSMYRSMTKQMNDIQAKTDEALISFQSAASEIENVATDLNEANLSGIANNINTLATNATEDLEITMEKINEIDIESLNNSIERLDDATGAFETAVNSLRNLIPSWG